jgi:hypothetical protein
MAASQIHKIHAAHLQQLLSVCALTIAATFEYLSLETKALSELRVLLISSLWGPLQLSKGDALGGSLEDVAACLESLFVDEPESLPSPADKVSRYPVCT